VFHLVHLRTIYFALYICTYYYYIIIIIGLIGEGCWVQMSICHFDQRITVNLLFIMLFVCTCVQISLSFVPIAVS